MVRNCWTSYESDSEYSKPYCLTSGTNSSYNGPLALQQAKTHCTVSVVLRTLLNASNLSTTWGFSHHVEMMVERFEEIVPHTRSARN